jgi:hypothetical protein
MMVGWAIRSLPDLLNARLNDCYGEVDRGKVSGARLETESIVSLPQQDN